MSINSEELFLLRSVVTDWLDAADNYKAFNMEESELNCRQKAAELQRLIAEYLDRHTSDLQNHIAEINV